MRLFFAVPYLLTIAAASRARVFPIWSLWVASWLPLVVTWAPADDKWVETWWLFWMVPASLFQAMSVIEAFYSAAGRFRFSVNALNAIAFIALGAMIAVMQWPDGGAVAQMIDFALIERTGAAVALTLAVAFFASLPTWRWSAPASRHLVLCCLMTWTFALPSMLSLNPWNRAVWFTADAFLSWTRALILLGWTVSVPNLKAVWRVHQF